MEVSWPGQIATVLVAFACTGRIFMPKKAGKDKNEPPPATAFSTPARNAATTSQTQCQLTVASQPERCIMRSNCRVNACVGLRPAVRGWAVAEGEWTGPPGPLLRIITPTCQMLV